MGKQTSTGTQLQLDIAVIGTPKKFAVKAAKGDGLKASFEIKLSAIPVYPA